MARKPAYPGEDEDTLDVNKAVPADAVATGGTIDTTKSYFVRHTKRYATRMGVVCYEAGAIVSDPFVINQLYAVGAVLEPTT